MFENIITQYPKKAVNAHVQSYFINNQFLKAKLHMSCMMLHMFDFNAANEIIWILQQKVYEPNLEKNIFAHNANPLMAMC